MSYWEADVGAGLVLTWNKCAKTPSLNKCDQKHKEESRYQSGNRYLRERGIWHFCLAGWSKWWKEGTTLSCSLCFALKPQFFKTYLMSRRKKNVFWFGQTLMHFLHCLCKSVNLPYVKKKHADLFSVEKRSVGSAKHSKMRCCSFVRYAWHCSVSREEMDGYQACEDFNQMSGSY